MAYVAIANADIDPESPITGTLMTRLRDNPIELATGDLASGAPTINRPSLEINGAAATSRALWFQTSGVNRWLIQASDTAETGSDAGSNLTIRPRNDAGGAKADAVTINRATGLVTIPSLDASAFTSTRSFSGSIVGSGGTVNFALSDIYAFAPRFTMTAASSAASLKIGGYIITNNDIATANYTAAWEYIG